MSSIITTAFVVVGLSAIFFGVRNVFHSRDTASWLVVPGTVVGSEIVQTRCGGRNAFDPRVRYEYQVGAETYRSDRISFDATCHGTRDSASKVTRDLGVGARIAVYYSPEDPSRSVLVPEVGETGGWIVAAIGGAFLVIGLFRDQLFRRLRPSPSG